MVANAFIKLDKAESAQLISEINPILQEGPFSPQTTTMLEQELSFYPGCRFFEIADYSITPSPRKYVITGKGGNIVLNWTNGPIYKLNERLPIKLNAENVIDYARFFFSYIKGRHGRFIIVETIEDIQWSEEPPAAARKAIAQLISPIILSSTGKDGTFHLTVCMIFKDALFRTDAHIKPNGLVDLSNEELLIENMPILDDLFAQ